MEKFANFMIVAHVSKNVVLLKLRSDDNILSLLRAHDDSFGSKIKLYRCRIICRVSELNLMFEKKF